MPDSVTASDDYALRFAGPAGPFLLAVQNRSLSNLLRAEPSLPKGASVLDHAGTHGQLAKILLGLGYQRTVSASSAELVDRSNAMSPKVVGDLANLDLLDQSFDAVVCVRLLAHSVDVERSVQEMCRLARHSVIVDYPSLRSANIFSRWLFKFKKRIEGNTREYSSISDRALERYFAKVGFKLAHTERQFFVPMALHRAIGNNALIRGVEVMARSLGLTRIMGNPVVARFDRITNG